MDSQDEPRSLLAVHSARRAGAELLALGFAETLASDQKLLIAIGRGPLRARFARLGQLIRGPTSVPIWGASRRRWVLQIARAIPDAVRLALVVRRRRIQVIVANSTVLVAPVVAARLARVPVLVYAHEAPKSPGVLRLFRFHGALADTVIAASSWVAEGFGLCRARVVVIPPGITIPPWIDRPPRESGPVRVLTVGTIDSQKQQHLAIRAMAKLRNAGIDAYLEIVGREADKGYAATLHELVSSLGLSERVTFVGESSDVAGHMRRADVVLVPAGEVTPVVLMEAMAIGTPVVATRMGSIPDVVVDGESGLLVEPDDPDALAGAVQRLCDPELADRIVKRARERVETKFGATRYLEMQRAELRRLASSSQ
jgi:glycosyltransferase involved in cell wall biosynthesis